MSILTVADYIKLPPTPASARYPYGEDPAQFVDLYLPTMPPVDPAGYPVVVLIHGGCWGAQYGLEPLGPFCQQIAAQGIAVWNLEYRRIDNGGGWPMTFLDVAAGTDLLRSAAADHPLNVDRVVAVGHSAGGHLALWLAARNRLPADSAVATATSLPLTGVLSLAGIPDLTDAEARDICRGAVPQLLGGPSSSYPERYREGSPSSWLPLGVPQQLIIGTQDQAVPLVHNEAYVAAAEAAGDDVTLQVLPEIGHFEIVIPGTSVWPLVEEAILVLLTT